MTTPLTYHFGNQTFSLYDDSPHAILEVRWTMSIWARFHFRLDGTSEVTTPNIPRFFNALSIHEAQKRYAEIIRKGREAGGTSAFKILQTHFAARKTKEAIQNS